MKHAIDIPDFKFKSGQVVKRMNANNDKCIYLHIERIIGEGKFKIVDDVVTIDDTYLTYMCVVQGGYYDSNRIEQIRPGICLCIDCFQLDQIAEIVEWGSDIVTSDTPENWISRIDGWDKTNQDAQLA